MPQGPGTFQAFAQFRRHKKKVRTSPGVERIEFLDPFRAGSRRVEDNIVDTFGNHFRPMLRRLMHSPMFTIVTLVTIGLAVGANTAIFSLISGILLKPLPYSDPERLVSVWQSAPALNIPDCNL